MKWPESYVTQTFKGQYCPSMAKAVASFTLSTCHFANMLMLGLDLLNVLLVIDDYPSMTSKMFIYFRTRDIKSGKITGTQSTFYTAVSRQFFLPDLRNVAEVKDDLIKSCTAFNELLHRNCTIIRKSLADSLGRVGEGKANKRAIFAGGQSCTRCPEPPQ